jgi:Lon protease-like protein
MSEPTVSPSGSAVLPMFPLGTVLLPGAVLPLHVFEPRYRALVADCLAGEPEFGVVLIERGSEVGGGDVRRDVGTVARIVEITQLPGDRYALVTVGTRRIRVERWLDEEPYPRAEVTAWPEADDGGHGPAVEELLAQLRRVLALLAELGEPAAPATTAIADDPVLATYHLAALAPLGPDDRDRLLRAPGPGERRQLLGAALADAEAMLRFRLAP